MVMGADQKDVQEIRVEVAFEEVLEQWSELEPEVDYEEKQRAQDENAALEEVHLESGSEKAASEGRVEKTGCSIKYIRVIRSNTTAMCEDDCSFEDKKRGIGRRTHGLKVFRFNEGLGKFKMKFLNHKMRLNWKRRRKVTVSMRRDRAIRRSARNNWKKQCKVITESLVSLNAKVGHSNWKKRRKKI